MHTAISIWVIVIEEAHAEQNSLATPNHANTSPVDLNRGNHRCPKLISKCSEKHLKGEDVMARCYGMNRRNQETQGRIWEI